MLLRRTLVQRCLCSRAAPAVAATRSTCAQDRAVTSRNRLELVLGPDPGNAVVDGHQRGQAAFLHQRHANRRGDADALERRRFLGREFARLSLTTSGRPALRFLTASLPKSARL